MRIAVFGAGAVGCYIGGCLAANGAEVVLIGRPRLGDELAAHGLRVTDYRGRNQETRRFEFETTPEAVAGSDVVLVCVKSQDTQAAIDALRHKIPEGAVAISFQNGVDNAEELTNGLGRPVHAGMVGFNIAAQGGGHFHQGTQGDLHCTDDPALSPVLPVFKQAALPLEVHPDMRPVLWAKLMLNLNNAVNALANIPLRDQLSQRAFRDCLAMAQSELLALVAASELPGLAKLSPLPPAWIPRVLRLPNALFNLIAGSMLRIDPLARSSMSDDLALGRPTEVRWINGAVTRLADKLGQDAPVNKRLCDLVEEASGAPARPTWQASNLLKELQKAAV